MFAKAALDEIFAIRCISDMNMRYRFIGFLFNHTRSRTYIKYFNAFLTSIGKMDAICTPSERATLSILDLYSSDNLTLCHIHYGYFPLYSYW